jgi:hypothetical protein
MPGTRPPCPRVSRLEVPLLAALLAASAARGQTAASSPPLVILGPERAAEVEQRRAEAEAAVAESELAMNRRFDASYRARIVDRLASGRSLGVAPARTEGTNALGDTGADLVYTPVTPCRALDTRLSAEGAVAPGAPRTFLVAGTERFEAQGGKAGGCGVPLGPATAIAVNLTVVQPGGNGHLRGWAAGSPPPPPPTSVLNFGIVPGLGALANAVVLPICDEGALGGPCASDLQLQAYGSSTHVVGDVLGYFRAADAATSPLSGASGFGPVQATASTLHLGYTIFTTPPRFVYCTVTCSITLKSNAANSVGYAFVQGGASAVDVTASGWGGPEMYVAPVASPGAASATTATEMGLGESLRWQFGCHVATAGDFVGDELTGAVSWVCR